MSQDINKTFSQILDELDKPDFEQGLIRKDLLLESDN